MPAENKILVINRTCLIIIVSLFAYESNDIAKKTKLICVLFMFYFYPIIFFILLLYRLKRKQGEVLSLNLYGYFR